MINSSLTNQRPQLISCINISINNNNTTTAPQSFL
jgi:hypothetical protein